MEESFWKRFWTCHLTDYWWWRWWSQGVLVQTFLNSREHLLKHSPMATIITTLPPYGQMSERLISFLTYKQFVIKLYFCCRGNYHPYIWHRYPRLLGCREWRHARQVQDWLVAIGQPLHHKLAGPWDQLLCLQTRVLNTRSFSTIFILTWEISETIAVFQRYKQIRCI